MKKNVLLALAALVLVMILGSALYYYVGMSQKEIDSTVPVSGTSTTMTPPGSSVSFGGDVYQKTGAADPVEKIPDTNPFERTVNPYTDTYQNPF